MRRKSKKEVTYVYIKQIQFALQKKLTQHRKVTILFAPLMLIPQIPFATFTRGGRGKSRNEVVLEITLR